MSNPNGQLRNLDSRDVLTQQVSDEDFERKTVSFYRYVILKDPEALRHELYGKWSELGVLGRVYLAEEGVNAQISIPEPNWNDFISLLGTYAEFTDMPFKIAVEEPDMSFLKLAIKVKKQIVADGLTMEDYDITNVGTHLNPEAFHEMMNDPDAIVVDMRNQYESEIGHFEGAILPDVDTFREELPATKELLKGKEDKKVMLYCTGGIRCEKASAYLKHNGFKDVYQLYGGVINYAHEIKEKGLDSKFKGKNFVFDDRRAERITEDVLSNCHLCDEACDTHRNCANEMCNLLFLQCETCFDKLKGTCSKECKTIAALPEEERRALRKNQQRPHTFQRYRRSLRPKELG
jgi:UPF0176 protein